MKTKSLLVAVFSVLAMIAYADTFSCASRVILPEGFVIGPGETDASFWPVVLYREGDYTDNFTNLQINIFLPDGLNVIDCVSHNDTKFYNEDTGEEQQALNLTTSMHPDGYYVVNLSNVTYHGDQIKITKNPIVIVRMKFAASKDFKGGLIKAYLKYTDYANNVFVNEECFMGSSFPPPLAAVEQINAGKSVASVKYYNVAGQVADSAFEGVNIVVTTYVDKSQSIVKIVK